MLNVQVIMTQNALIGEKVASARLVNLQSLTFDQFCDYVAEGSTVTAADVSAVMKRLETVLPLVLCLNTKVQASPFGLTFRPAVKGSMTQSELRKKLEAKKADLLKAGDAEGAAKIDVERELKASDLSTADMTPYIEVTMPSRWDSNFKQMAEFKRITKAVASSGEELPGDNPPSGNQTKTKYTLTVLSANPEQGTVSGGGEFEEGSEATIQATAASGYMFTKWDDGNTNSTRTVTVSADATYTAQFTVLSSEL